MESIVKASEANKIKVKKVVDNTARDVEIEVQLPLACRPISPWMRYMPLRIVR